jgi:hypothetical protein
MFKNLWVLKIIYTEIQEMSKDIVKKKHNRFSGHAFF